MQDLGGARQECLAEQGAMAARLANSTIPIRSYGVNIRHEPESDGMHLVYEPQDDLVFLMNTTGKLIFDLCDGRKTIQEIANCIEQMYSIPEGTDVAGAVRAYLGVLLSRHMIEIEQE